MSFRRMENIPRVSRTKHVRIKTMAAVGHFRILQAVRLGTRGAAEGLTSVLIKNYRITRNRRIIGPLTTVIRSAGKMLLSLFLGIVVNPCLLRVG